MGEFNPVERPLEYLNPEKVAKLLFLSFKFSQGDIDYQVLLFQALSFLRPRSIIKETDIPAIKDALLPMLEKFFSSGKLHTAVKKPIIETEVTIRIKQMVSFFNKERDVLDSFFLKEIARRVLLNVISRDSDFTSPEIGRKNAQGAKRSDTYESHFVKYILASHATGAEEFSELFAKAKDEAIEILNDPEPDAVALARQNKMHFLIDQHNKHFPDQQVVL